MKVEELPSGSYRVRKTYNKKVYTVIFNHKPNQKEVALAIAERLEEDNVPQKGTFEQKAKEYMKARENVTSPSTIGGYEKILRQMSPEFKTTNINDLDQTIIQEEINRYAPGHAPKTVKNFYGLISAVMNYYRPKYVYKVTLPQAQKFEAYLPEEDEIKAILKMVKNTEYSVPFQLGVMGLRRSEVCALEITDLKGNTLSINKAYIYDKNNKPIIKPLTKSTEGKREIYLPDTLAAEIRQKGYIFDQTPGSLLQELHRIQNLLGITEFRFHDLRHYYASYAHDHGMSDAAIKETGGWATDHVMKNIYRRAMKKSKEQKQMEIASSIL